MWVPASCPVLSRAHAHGRGWLSLAGRRSLRAVGEKSVRSLPVPTLGVPWAQSAGELLCQMRSQQEVSGAGWAPCCPHICQASVLTR